MWVIFLELAVIVLLVLVVVFALRAPKGKEDNRQD